MCQQHHAGITGWHLHGMIVMKYFIQAGLYTLNVTESSR